MKTKMALYPELTGFAGFIIQNWFLCPFDCLSICQNKSFEGWGFPKYLLESLHEGKLEFDIQIKFVNPFKFQY